MKLSSTVALCVVEWASLIDQEKVISTPRPDMSVPRLLCHSIYSAGTCRPIARTIILTHCVCLFVRTLCKLYCRVILYRHAMILCINDYHHHQQQQQQQHMVARKCQTYLENETASPNPKRDLQIINAYFWKNHRYEFGHRVLNWEMPFSFGDRFGTYGLPYYLIYAYISNTKTWNKSTKFYWLQWISLM